MSAKYTYCFVLIFFLFQNVLGDIIGYNVINESVTFKDAESTFGTSIGENILWGNLFRAEPDNACQPIQQRPNINTSYPNRSYAFVIIVRKGCDFATKVMHAQYAQYDAAIVYDPDSDQLIQMSSLTSLSQEIMIPSVFVGVTTGIDLLTNYLYTKPYQPQIGLKANTGFPFSWTFIAPFCAIIVLCFVLILVFMCIKYLQTRRRQRRNRLSRQRLKQLPTKIYDKGDVYDVCAICLDEYEEGEKLRILPCRHAYHCKCVDPWLTSSKRVCPLCKRKVLSDDESSGSDSEYAEDADTDSEDAPLLQNASAASPNAPRYATGFSTENPFLRNYPSSPEPATSPLSTSCPLLRDVPSSSGDRLVTLAQRPAAPPNPHLCVYVNEEMTPEASPILNDMASSSITCESTDAYRSCQSDDDGAESDFSFDSIQIIHSRDNSPPNVNPDHPTYI